MTKKQKTALLKNTKAILVESIFQLQREISDLVYNNEDLINVNNELRKDADKLKDANISIKHEQNGLNKKVARLEYELQQAEETIKTLVNVNIELEEKAASKFTLVEIIGFVILAVLITAAL